MTRAARCECPARSHKSWCHRGPQDPARRRSQSGFAVGPHPRVTGLIRRWHGRCSRGLVPGGAPGIGGVRGGGRRPGTGKGNGIGRRCCRMVCPPGARPPKGVSVVSASSPIAYTSASDSRMICFSVLRSVWLLVSLPSEMTSSAFLRCRPDCSSGNASATASYSAVAPSGLVRRSAELMRLRSVVQLSARWGMLSKV